LIAFETILALSAGAVGIPGLFLIRLAKGGGAEAPQPATASEGGESVIAKLEAANEPSHQTKVAAKPLPPVVPAGPPRLDGLADIPLTPWDRDEAKPDKPTAFAANSAGREVLPWDAVEPVPYPTGEPDAAPADATASLPAEVPAAPRARAAPIELPASGEVKTWVKAKATEIKGEERARPLYHFEYWLEPPEDMKGRLAAVAYAFNARGHAAVAGVERARHRLPHSRWRAHVPRQGHHYPQIQRWALAAGRRRRVPAGGQG
jgi:hypothetical protein